MGVMTPFPHSVEVSETIGSALAMMQEHGIRHLPVTEDRALIGVLSERDLGVAQRMGGDPDNTSEVTVGTVCKKPPHIVENTTPLDVVLDEMAAEGFSSAVVVRQGKLVGILTSTDVCNYLAQMLREIAPPPGDDDVA